MTGALAPGEVLLGRDESTRQVPDPERLLLDRCRRGDDGAAEEMVRLHSGPVYRLAYRLLGDRDEARDLTQEVFLRAFRRLDGFRAESSLKTWLFRITTNAARNRRRSWSRKHRSRTVPLDEASEGELPPVATLTAGGPGPEQELLASAIRHRLAEALQELPRDFREAVVLRDVEGMDYRTMARILGVRVGTVKSRIARGREALRIRLQDLLA